MEKIYRFLFFHGCFLCGKREVDSICNSCYANLKKDIIFQIDTIEGAKHLWIFHYQGWIRSQILDFKFHEKSYLANFFVKIIRKNEKISDILNSYDIIIPVPIHAKRKAQRGYNQSSLIARKLAKELKLKIEEEILEKKQNNIAQSTLQKEERIKNVKNVYAVKNKQKIEQKRIILLDDIYTTGATAKECIKLLQQHGAKEILVLTLAKD